MISPSSTCPQSSKPLFEVSTVEAALVPGVYELEEEHGAVLADREVADLVEQCGAPHYSTPLQEFVWADGASG